MKRTLAILDFGSQYTHLLASRIRSLGCYCEIVAPEELDAKRAKAAYAGLIYSGGPASVYDKSAPRCDEGLSRLGLPILGICYGHQLLMRQHGAKVIAAKKAEYGPAKLQILADRGIFHGDGLPRESTVWMSHGDEVQELPPHFEVLGKTEDCAHAAVGDCKQRIFGLQFHPEVEHTQAGAAFLRGFIRLCGLENSWKLKDFLEEEEAKLSKQLSGRKVFFLLSGGVDSTVAFSMLARILAPEHLIGVYVDTGFMRHNEAKQVKEACKSFSIDLRVVDASEKFYAALKGVSEPEKKRDIIGELFIEVQRQAALSLGLNVKDWYIGQGTIYPDQIESGASKHSHSIKTHHNRVAGINELIKQGKIVEPISRLYKNEVRELGEILGLPRALTHRHPFPGPGLAVRCLCASRAQESQTLMNKARLLQKKWREPWQELLEENCAEQEQSGELGYSVLPIRSVGVQGDQRTYRNCLALLYKNDVPDWSLLLELARKIPNRFVDINRVLLCLGSLREPSQYDFSLEEAASLSEERISLLRQADHKVSEFMREENIYDKIWQFPVVLLPLTPTHAKAKGDAVVLRPVLSSDAMTASVYCMPFELLAKLHQRLLELPGCQTVFYDLTNKPPATIEWE